ncbi:hypothetical protein JX265_003078 [Neoarthrinium moseri]|uniref:4-coumarate:coenzyme a ligase n=1 Tax=Neoarthrinium moseri TaxID=1658444 RepID=A0A9P9WT71_9PEZI|nr:uncharacterized protein JN550_005994 [Neoarthrinium moseri]KAI1852596.1 hypothetical protein JX266_002137 [Neoarthrinium moseri]KAI1869007.1 hypothetical protein JN550_005994 [Neoarthrinium moseri]KAI1878901.1 hypothetical protein JX265_003078 [Neoarthrinium moseri]
MPVRIPKAGAIEGVAFATAGVVGFAPFYFMLPSANQRLASQTLKWAPRWERNISYFAPPAERVAQRVEPRVHNTVVRVDNRLPLEKMAKGVDRRIKNGVDRFQPKH